MAMEGINKSFETSNSIGTQVILSLTKIRFGYTRFQLTEKIFFDFHFLLIITGFKSTRTNTSSLRHALSDSMHASGTGYSI